MQPGPCGRVERSQCATDNSGRDYRKYYCRSGKEDDRANEACAAGLG
jgi:hypothetical protein